MLPPFVDPARPQTPQLAVVAATFAALELFARALVTLSAGAAAAVRPMNLLDHD